MAGAALEKERVGFVRWVDRAVSFPGIVAGSCPTAIREESAEPLAGDQGSLEPNRKSVAALTAKEAPSGRSLHTGIRRELAATGAHVQRGGMGAGAWTRTSSSGTRSPRRVYNSNQTRLSRGTIEGVEDLGTGDRQSALEIGGQAGDVRPASRQRSGVPWDVSAQCTREVVLHSRRDQADDLL